MYIREKYLLIKTSWGHRPESFKQHLFCIKACILVRGIE